MTLVLKSLAVDKNDEENGRWEDYAPWGVRFRVRGIQCRAYLDQKATDENMAKRRRQDDLPEWRYRRSGENIATNVLLEWDGFDIPYSAETAKTLLTDPEYRELLAAVIFCAVKVSTPHVRHTEDGTEDPAGLISEGSE